MDPRPLITRSWRTLPVALLALVANAAAQVQVRPITDLLRSQGTFTPPESSNRWDEKAPAAWSAVPLGLPIYIEATEPGGDP